MRSLKTFRRRYEMFKAWLDGARDDSGGAPIDKADALRIVQTAARNHGGLECATLSTL
eukprot:SAG31_NODE_2049_length_6564_cov_13.995824_8_plen_58_part_00